MLEIDYHYDFSELKAGDKFAYEGVDYEKISGNMAVAIRTDKIKDFEANSRVYLYELY